MSSFNIVTRLRLVEFAAICAAIFSAGLGFTYFNMSELGTTRFGPIPAIGLGVYRSPPGPATYNAVLSAIELGYRHIDTAALYGNEADVAKAIRDSGVPRAEIFVTTKLWTAQPSPGGDGYKDAIRGVDEALKKMQLDYVDLMLLHSPHYERLDRWRGLEKCVAEGKIRYIGVSNFGEHHLIELLKVAKIKPLVNQIEVHVFLARKELCEYCANNGILVEAYSPLAKATEMKHPTLIAIAKKHRKTVAQVMLRFLLERNLIILPKSEKKDRQAENANIFDFSLDEADRAQLWALDVGKTTG
jgi:diketogulonate reductase-like aldo/keto reductase